jgi:NAD(P)-dependent dehydrogenase (short-subunit alcohol dehydrogenase family)
MRFNRGSTAQEVAQSADLRGRQIVLTGAASGIGAETARALALAGADLVLGARDLAKGQALADTLEGPGRIMLLPLDLSDFASVVAFAGRVAGPVDHLIANAGVSKTPQSHLPNGLELRFATNHLGHFLLSWRLRPQLAMRGARIIAVSSAAHKNCPVQLDDLQWHNRPHIDGLAYAESKTANILFTQEATRRWSAQGIFANAVLPGSALTGLQRYHGDELKRRIGFIDADGRVNAAVKTSAQAAATTVWAATAPELNGRGGLVLEDCAAALAVGPGTHAWSGYDASVAGAATASRLWDMSLDLIKDVVK